ncbi:MAG: site-specific integrase [Chitinophagaceae bacterium]|nr:MAG: site-specific integrase [Chitinophagaceae bacterium]
MAKNNLTILFWLNKAKANKKGETPIYLRISYDNKRKTLSTGFSITPERWDSSKGQVKGSKDESKQINAYITQTRAKLMELFNEMLRRGDIHFDTLIERFFGRDSNNKTLLELVGTHNCDFERRIGIDYTESTFEKYDILRRKLEAFIPFKYHRKDIRLVDITHSFMADFEFYLKDHDKNEHNTAVKYLKNLKKIINLALINGWLEDNPFKGYKSNYKDVDRVYLTQAELDSIEAKEFRIGRLRLVKDLFLFQCYTGLAYSDMTNLTFGNLAPGIDGGKWIFTRRRKTDVRSAIPLLPKAESVIKKYESANSSFDQRLFPTYSIQKFNSYLNEIADLCNISKRLTSHVGRRTFATTIALSNGISLETISKILGHSTTKITAQYAVVTDYKVSQEIGQLKSKLLKKR